MATSSKIFNQRFLIVGFLSFFTFFNPSAFSLATPSIKTRGRTHKGNAFSKSPLFMSSTDAARSSGGGSSSSSSDISAGVVNGDATATFESENTMFAKLRQVSNFASFLCVLDCTLLPIITVALPLLGFVNLGASQMEFLHVLGHKLALFFVLPVGGLTGVLNYLSHKKAWIASMTAVGLTLVGFANAHIHHLPIFGHVEFLHMIQHGPLHRVVNILGCAFLLGSNYLSQKQGCAFDHECSSSSHSHDHSHSHAHGHKHSH